jgi:hypothetical protein
VIEEEEMTVNLSPGLDGDEGEWGWPAMVSRGEGRREEVRRK